MKCQSLSSCGSGLVSSSSLAFIVCVTLRWKEVVCVCYGCMTMYTHMVLSCDLFSKDTCTYVYP